MSLSFEFQEQLRAIEESIKPGVLTSEINDLQNEIREGYMPEKKPAPDYGEPWRDQIGCVRDRMNFFVSLRSPATADRVIACVNACAGMADPSAEIQAMRVAIKEIYAEADAYADGASDASAHDKFCNEIAAKHGYWRTSRPLTFEHAGKQWTWHRPGDPMPCDGERMVHVLISDDLADDPPLQARQIEWNREDAGDVIGWRYADADEKKTVPLEPEDVPPGSVFRSKDQPATQFWTVTQVWDGGFYLRGDNVEWNVAMQRMEINRSIPLTGKWDASAWEPCSKQI